MKKRLIILLTLCITASCLASCGKTVKTDQQISTETADNALTTEENVVSEEATIANPMSESSEADIKSTIGGDFTLSEDCTDAKYFIYDLSDGQQMGEVQFTYNKYTKCSLRIQKTDSYTDISGENYEWDFTEYATLGDCICESMRHISEKETVDVCIWYDDQKQLMYSLSAKAADLDGFDIGGLAGIVSGLKYEVNFDAEIWYPNDFLQERTQKDQYESYEEIISLLQSGEAYAYGKVIGCEGESLFITSGVYDNGDGNMASIEAYLYTNVNGSIINVGNIFSDGTAYPVRLDNGIIYTAGNHKYESSFVCEETNGLMVKDYISEEFDENGNASYYSFTREVNSFDGPETDQFINSQEEFYQYIDEYSAKPVLNFTVVK